VAAAFDADATSFDMQRLVERDWFEIFDGHFFGEGDDVAEFVDLAHGVVEDAGDDAAVRVSGWAGVAFAEAKARDECSALFIECELQVHAVRVVHAADEAIVFLQLDVWCAVSGAGVAFGFLDRHQKFYRERRLGFSIMSRRREMLMPAAVKRSSSYSVHPGVAQTQKWVGELFNKTGRSLEEWLSLTKKAGPATEKERRDWLKKEHGFGTNSAGWMAGRLAGKNMEEDSPEAYLKTAAEWVEAQYSGPRAGLRPLYEQLLKLGFSLGREVKACPCKTMVPFYRHHVFAQIKPATNTRIDLGLAVGNMKTPKRLIDTGGYEKKDRITRRIEIRSKADIDDEVKRWLRTAYGMDE
jgi:Domain of unknown function (DUF5655)/Domain of unknown function (DUF4287)